MSGMDIRALDLGALAEALGVGDPRQREREQDYLRKMDRVIDLGFEGDDADARAARHFAAHLRADMEFMRDDPDPVSRLVSEPMASYMDESAKLFRALADLAVARCAALGIDTGPILHADEEDGGGNGSDGG